RAVSGDHPFRLEISTPGNLDDLTLRTTARQKPGPGEIEIRVHAAGLNFSDVMRAMDIYPGLAAATIPLGIECAGQVTALGEDVVAFQVGDEVLAIAPFGIGTFVTVSTDLVVPKPAHLSCEEAATIPIAFLTAHYALDHLARLRRGD